MLLTPPLGQRKGWRKAASNLPIPHPAYPRIRSAPASPGAPEADPRQPLRIDILRPHLGRSRAAPIGTGAHHPLAAAAGAVRALLGDPCNVDDTTTLGFTGVGLEPVSPLQAESTESSLFLVKRSIHFTRVNEGVPRFPAAAATEDSRTLDVTDRPSCLGTRQAIVCPPVHLAALDASRLAA